MSYNSRQRYPQPDRPVKTGSGRRADRGGYGLDHTPARAIRAPGRRYATQVITSSTRKKPT